MKSSRPTLFALCILLAVLFSIHHTGRAQASSQVGLVVEFSDGSLYTGCITFEADSISGYDLLARSGLSLETAIDPSQGVAVCKIESDGCPADDCFCQMPEYWSYWNMGDGGWVYAGSGSSLNRVGNGDVDGWSWGAGNPPPAFNFNQLCAPPPPPPPTETSPPLPSFTHTPEPQPSDTPEPEPTDTFIPPSATEAPSNTPFPDSPTPSPTASHTSALRASATHTAHATLEAVATTPSPNGLSINPGIANVPAPTHADASLISPASQAGEGAQGGRGELVGYAVFGALLISLGLALTRIILKGRKL